MKKWMAVSIVIGLVLALAACGSSQTATAPATTSNTLPLESRLLVGSLKLDSTSLAITAAQAGQLLPLWETLQSLASSGIAASQEVDAVVSQIETTLSAQQLDGITAMNLTQQDLALAISDTGASSAGSASSSASSAQHQTAAGGPTGDYPGGGNPPADMGGSLPASAGAQSATSSTQVTSTQTTAASSQVQSTLIQALVELLQKKIG